MNASFGISARFPPSPQVQYYRAQLKHTHSDIVEFGSFPDEMEEMEKDFDTDFSIPSKMKMRKIKCLRNDKFQGFDEEELRGIPATFVKCSNDHFDRKLRKRKWKKNNLFQWKRGRNVVDEDVKKTVNFDHEDTICGIPAYFVKKSKNVFVHGKVKRKKRCFTQKNRRRYVVS